MVFSNITAPIVGNGTSRVCPSIYVPIRNNRESENHLLRLFVLSQSVLCAYVKHGITRTHFFDHFTLECCDLRDKELITFSTKRWNRRHWRESSHNRFSSHLTSLIYSSSPVISIRMRIVYMTKWSEVQVWLVTEIEVSIYWSDILFKNSKTFVVLS